MNVFIIFLLFFVTFSSTSLLASSNTYEDERERKRLSHSIAIEVNERQRGDKRPRSLSPKRTKDTSTIITKPRSRSVTGKIGDFTSSIKRKVKKGIKAENDTTKKRSPSPKKIPCTLERIEQENPKTGAPMGPSKSEKTLTPGVVEKVLKQIHTDYEATFDEIAPKYEDIDLDIRVCTTSGAPVEMLEKLFIVKQTLTIARDVLLKNKGDILKTMTSFPEIGTKPFGKAWQEYNDKVREVFSNVRRIYASIPDARKWARGAFFDNDGVRLMLDIQFSDFEAKRKQAQVIAEQNREQLRKEAKQKKKKIHKEQKQSTSTSVSAS